MTIEIRVEKKNGVDFAAIIAKINLGPIAPPNHPDSIFETLPASPRYIMFALQQQIKSMETETPEQLEAFENTLTTYCQQWLLDLIGVAHHPLQYDEHGRITGLKEEYRIEEAGSHD
ncbi:hypothetical protein ACP26L_35920 (plasmid) [Paenibacillus sp. S-38]|uniref:hypothetical protein n=1 Tax=Paenibacillus sp. S-38 TaxID=3416710 RepID=UPI003CF4EB41